MSIFKNKVGRPSNEILMKRKIAYFVIACICILSVVGLALFMSNTKLLKGATTTAKTTTIIGDLDNSGKTDTKDADLLLKYINKKVSLTKDQLLKSDYDSDNELGTKKDYCAMLSSVSGERYLKECSSYGYNVKSYSGTQIYKYTKGKCSLSASNGCALNYYGGNYWSNSYTLNYFTNIAARYSNTVATVNITLPDDLSDYIEMRVDYYAGSDIRNMSVGVEFSINNLSSSLIKRSYVPGTNNRDGQMVYTAAKSEVINISKIKEQLSKGTSKNDLIIKVIHDGTRANTAAIKIKSISLVKKNTIKAASKQRNKNAIDISYYINGATKIGNKTTDYVYKECTSSKSCTVVLPKIERSKKDIRAFTILGWSTDPNATTAMYNQNQKVTFTKSTKLYAISFDEIEAISYNNYYNGRLTADSTKCKIYNKKTSCQVTPPSRANYGGGTLGFTDSKTSSEVKWRKDTPITISKDKTYLYRIYEKPQKATINLYANGSNYNGKSKVEITCKRVDCADGKFRLPKFKFSGKFSAYWCTTPNCSNNVYYPIGTLYNVGSGMNLYASTARYSSAAGKFIFSKAYQVNTSYDFKSVHVEILGSNTAPLLYKNSVENVYNKKGSNGENVRFLFDNPVDLMVLDESNYKSESFCGIGCTYGLSDYYSVITVNASYATSKNDENIYIHELGHAWDNVYRSKFGIKARETEAFKSYYNSYKNYWNCSIGEVFAASVTNYYWTYVAKKPDNAIYGLDTKKLGITGKQCTKSSKCNEIQKKFKTIMETLVSNYNSK